MMDNVQNCDNYNSLNQIEECGISQFISQIEQLSDTHVTT
jgi:hypothetical protein